MAKVTVISKDSEPFYGSLGQRIGTTIRKLFETKGVNFVLNSGLKRCIDNGSGAVGSVELSDGTILNADVCIMGIGSILNTEFLNGSGLEMNKYGALEVRRETNSSSY